MIAIYTCLTRDHDPRLVVLAALICLVSTTIGMDLLARARSRGEGVSGRWLWLLGAGFVCGTGIWATHFVAILAYDIGIPVGFDAIPTLVSVLFGTITCAIGFAALIGRPRWWRIALAGVVVGGGIGLLHYEGMAGLVIPNTVGWNYTLIELSVASGILWSMLAAALIARRGGLAFRLGAAAALSMAAISLHFTGMAAMAILPDLSIDAVAGGFPHSTIVIAVSIGICAIVLVALATSIFDHVLMRRSFKEAERLLQLNAELAAARDRAEAANRAKSEFLAMMSHEIKTPLAGMIGMINLMARTGDRSEQARCAALAQDSAENLLAVINGVLDFSQLEAGRLQLEAIDFDVVRLLSSTTEFFRPTIEAKGLRLEVRLAADLPREMNGDPNRIRQVLSNLLSNAAKFTHTGKIEVDASCAVGADGIVDLRVEVADTGVGIPADARAGLFQPFVQADSSISRRYGGSGLGLSVSRQLCRLMGGDIALDRNCGETGSRFWFTVGCRMAQSSSKQMPSPSIVADCRWAVLVAEDTEIIAKLVRGILQAEGHEPTVVSSGAEALAMVQTRQFDVVLMDIQMPGMDGVTATRAIRRLEGPAGAIPIIALTANTTPDEREDYIRAGMNDCVSKPIRPAELFRAISSCIRPAGAFADPSRSARETA